MGPFICHGPTTKRCCISQIFMCARQNRSHLSGKSPQDINSTIHHSSYNFSSTQKWSRAWIQSLPPEHLRCLTVGVLIGTVLANCPRQCQGMFWCWGFFTTGSIGEVTLFWEEDSLPIGLQAMPLAGEGAPVQFICW